jgi:hypothetical protein
MTSATTHPMNPGRNTPRARASLSLISGAIVVGVLISGCGGSSPTASARQSSVTQARTQFVGFAACMRSHGLADYPDPLVSGSDDQVQVRISPGSLDPKSPAFRSADRACRHLLPNGGAPAGTGGNSAQQQAHGVLFADCMRSHGVPGFPDPDHDGVFTLPLTINEQAPAFLRAIHACQRVQPCSLSIDQSS